MNRYTATLPTKHAELGKNYSDTKELVDAISVVGLLPDGSLHEFVTARCYMGRSSQASKVYACVWLHGNGVHSAGHGSAGGGGYCKRSAALDAAIQCAGVKLDKSVDGVGMDAAREALEAIALAMGATAVLSITH